MNLELNSNSIDHLVQCLIDSNPDALANTMKVLLNEAMKVERSQALAAAPYERTSARRGYANGFKPKTFNSRLGSLQLAIPQTRDSKFYPCCIQKGLRSERALTLAMAQMYVQGVSTRKVTKVLEELCGLEISSTQVSQATEALDAELQKWRNRKLGKYPYLILDARYEKVRYEGAVRDCALLIAIGVDSAGKRDVLGVSVSLSEAEVHWREFLQSLLERGLGGLRHIISDDHPGLKQARRALLPAVPWQRCQCHLQQNAQAHVPKVEMRQQVATDIRTIFNAADSAEAQQKLQTVIKKYEKTAPKLAEWIEQNIPEGLTVFNLPDAHQKRLRTTNPLERLNQEIKRRTRVVRIFPNPESLLRLASAILMETSENWQTESKPYLNMKGI